MWRFHWNRKDERVNKYKITTFNFGNSASVIIEATDMVQALNSGLVIHSNVVKIEFYGSTEIIDYTVET